MPLELNGVPMGFTLQGVQRIPLNIKVGDVLPIFETVGALFPKTTTKTVKDQVFAGLQTSTTTKIGPFQDTSTGKLGNGLYTETTTSAVYNTIDVEVRKTVSVSSHGISYVNARVTRTEELTIGGKKYTSYVIESENWTKGQANTTFDATRASTAKAQARLQQNLDDKAAKQLVKWGFTNEDGYIVTFKEEWFVPELSVVKVRVFDMYGAITSETMLQSIQ